MSSQHMETGHKDILILIYIPDGTSVFILAILRVDPAR